MSEKTCLDRQQPATDSDSAHHDAENVPGKSLAGHVASAPDAQAPGDDLLFVADKIAALSVDEARRILQDMLEYHKSDYNFPSATRDKIRRLLDGPTEKDNEAGWAHELKAEAALNRFYSPYPEVRAVTVPGDDPDLPCETIRAHFLGYFWVAIAQFSNALFSSRFPSINLSSTVLQILLYPSGLALAWALPDWGFPFRGRRVSLNPGPWTHKEQMLSTVIVSIGVSSTYAFKNLQTQELFYKDTWLTPAYSILLLLSTQVMGIGFAGLLRRFVIYPVETLWPNLLPVIALNRTLLLAEPKETVHGWTISRYKFFFITLGAMFLYFWVPNYLFTGLSLFSWMCWIAPNNFYVNMITGSSQGLGLNPLPSFDWNIFTTMVEPLTMPFFAVMQEFAGGVIGLFIVCAIYFTNTSYTSYLPLTSMTLFNNTAQPYEVKKILIPGTTIVNQTAYENYSPPFYSAGYLLNYGAHFVLFPLTTVFIFLDFWKPISKAFRSMGRSAVAMTKKIVYSLLRTFKSIFSGNFRGAWRELQAIQVNDQSIYDGFDDAFTDAMRHYPEVPDWWFLSLAFISLIFAIVIPTIWTQLHTPIWTIFFAIGINLTFLIPVTYLYAISGAGFGLNIVAELVIGYALPGNPEALMFIKAYGYTINYQADNYIGSLKMGTYVKIPPRAMFRGQVISTILTSFISYGVVQFVDHSITDICKPTQAQKFTCLGSVVNFSSSIVWGAIGPKRVFSELYPAIKWCFLLGFLLGLVWWAGKRFGTHLRARAQSALPAPVFNALNRVFFTPLSYLHNVHPSLVMLGVGAWAPYNMSYWFCSVYMALFFMWYIRRHKLAWWEKYNYILAAGLDGGVAFAALVIFFAVQWDPVKLHWWGNTVNQHTLDGGAGGLLVRSNLPEKGYFGPDKWY